MANTARVDGWISNALARGVSDLDLTITGSYQLSPKCSKLVKLKLNRWIDIALAAGGGVVSLPLLKTLALDSVGVCPKEFETLLHALPSLEELVLVNVRWRDRDVTVSSASLKTLTIKLGYFVSILSIDTPILLHYNYSGCVASDYPLVTMGNLVDAQIVFFLLSEHQIN